MAAPTVLHSFALLCFIVFAFITPRIQAHQANDVAGGLKLMSAETAVEWPMSMAKYIGLDEDDEFDDGLLEVDGGDEESEMGRRSLFWRRVHYYISYGALSANRIPCPPRSGRSYYTHNCFKSRTPVNPYHRGCSRITRCRR